MFNAALLVSLVIIFSVIILYAFTYIELLLIVYKLFYKEKFRPSIDFICTYLFIPILFFSTSYFAQKIPSYTVHLDLFFLSLALFFTSVVLFSLGLVVRETWEQKVQEMNIKLLSKYSLWIIQGIYLIAVILCFLQGLVSLYLSLGPLAAS